MHYKLQKSSLKDHIRDEQFAPTSLVWEQPAVLLVYGQSISLDSYAVHATLLRAIRPAPWPKVAALLKGVASVCKKIVVKVNAG